MRTGTKAFAIGALAALALTGQSLAAQELADARWTSFLGCWEPVGETETDGMLCVVPYGTGVEIFTWAEGEKSTSDLLVADGVMRSAEIEGCTGEEASRFSDDGRRVFTRSTFTCAADARQESSGIMAITSANEWSDVHSVDVDGERIAWVQHYRVASADRVAEAGLEDVTEGIGMAVRASRISASRPIDLDDVAEATREVHGKAVEAWIASRGEGLDFDGGDLVALADAGVSPGIIDVMVAVSYPNRFVIGTGDPEGIDEVVPDNRVAGYYPGLYGPYGFRSYFGDPYWNYGYYSRGAWGLYPRSPYYYGGGYYNPGYYYPTRVVVEPRADGGGRAVKGRGYTQGGSSSGGTVGRSGGAIVQPAGGSRTGSGSTGRTARPKSGRTEAAATPPAASGSTQRKAVPKKRGSRGR
ncbi:MAG: hypothetical protein J4G12_05275 [Gemmatimonadetes bacterium]|nr:hypothetical protein [Gemmatimonadota bacterium]